MQRGGEKSNFTMDTPDNISNQVIKFNISSAKALWQCILLIRDLNGTLPLLSFSWKHTAQTNHEKNTRQIPTEEQSTKYLSNHPQNYQLVIKSKASKKQEDTWQWNVVCHPGWGPGTGTLGEHWGHLNTSVNNNVRILVRESWRMYHSNVIR